MAEIRGNREYQFKGYHISEEIAKNPIKKKRWTFRDPHPNNSFYNRPHQRKWDDKGLGTINWTNETNSGQQFVKSQKPEADLRAEFYNAYKKYYRRVDIKRLEVQSTLNVDTKFKTAGESAEAESSLYKEKECMVLNIVLDSEKDDALVSGRVRRTVLSVPCSEKVLQRSKESDDLNGREEMEIENIKTPALRRIKVNKPLEKTCEKMSQSNEPSQQTSFMQNHYTNCSESLNTFDKTFLKSENRFEVISDQKQRQLPSRRTFATPGEIPRNENPHNKQDIEPDILLPCSQQKDFGFHLGASSRNDSAGSTSDSSESLEISDSKYTDVWGPSLVSLESEKKRTISGRDYRRRTIGPSKVPLKSDFHKKTHNVSETLSNSNMNPRMPSSSRLSNPYGLESMAGKSFTIEKSQKQNNLNSLEIQKKISCEEEGALTRNEGKNICNEDNRKLKATENDHEVKIQRNNQRNVASSSVRRFCNRQALGPNSERIYLFQKSTNDSHSRAMEYNDLEENEISQIQENKVDSSEPSQTESVNEVCTSKITGESENANDMTSEDQTSLETSSIRFRGLRGGRFKKSNKNLLKTFVINVAPSYPKSDENEEILENNNLYEDDPSYLTNCMENKHLRSQECLEMTEKSNCRGTGNYRYDPEVTKSNSSESANRCFNRFATRNDNRQAIGMSHCVANTSENTAVRRSICAEGLAVSYLQREAVQNISTTDQKGNIIKPLRILRKNKTNGISDDTELRLDCNTSNYQDSSTNQSCSSDRHSCDTTDSINKDIHKRYPKESEGSKTFKSHYSDEEFTPKVNQSQIHSQMLDNIIKDNESSVQGAEKYLSGIQRYSNIPPRFYSSNGNNKNNRIAVSKRCTYDKERGDYIENYYSDAEEPLQRTRHELEYMNEEKECSRNKRGTVPIPDENRRNLLFAMRSHAATNNISEPIYLEPDCVKNGPDHKDRKLNTRGIYFDEHGKYNIEEEIYTNQIPKSYTSKNSINNEPYEIHLIYGNGKEHERRFPVPNDLADFKEKNIMNRLNTSAMKIDSVPKLKDSSSNVYNNHNSKGCNTDCLQKGPTYSLDYTPKVQNLSKNKPVSCHEIFCKSEEFDECCSSTSVSDPVLHNKDDCVPEYQHRRVNKIHSRKESFKPCPSIYFDNSIKCCNEQQSPGGLCKRRNESNLCGYSNCINIPNCKCEKLPLYDSQLQNRRNENMLRRKENTCFCISSIGDSRFQSETSCPIHTQARNCIASSWPDLNERYCGSFFNDTALDCKEQWANIKSSNNPCCSAGNCCNYEKNYFVIDERRNGTPHSASCTEENCCFTHYDNHGLAYGSHDVDNDSLWTASGHQPKRIIPDSSQKESGDSYAANTTTFFREDQCRSSGQEDNLTPVIKGNKNRCAVYTINNTPQCNEKWPNGGQQRQNVLSRYEKTTKCSHIANVNANETYPYREELFPNRRERDNGNSCMSIENVVSSVSSRNDNEKVHYEQKWLKDSEADRNQVFSLKKKNNSISNHSNINPRYNRTPKQLRSKERKSFDFPNNNENDSLLSNRCSGEPRFLSEERWDSDDGPPVLINVDSLDETSVFQSVSTNEPTYLNEEQWETNGLETEQNLRPPRENRDVSIHSVNGSSCLREEQKYADIPENRKEIRRMVPFSWKEKSRKSASVHAVTDPIFQCEEQWASDEEKCEDHRIPNTLPKNRAVWKRGRNRRVFNPRRWEMVTDGVARNEYTGRQYRPRDASSHENSYVGSTLVFSNSRFNSNS